MDVINQALGNYESSAYFRYEGLSNHHPIMYTGVVALVFALVDDAKSAVFSFLLLQSGLCSFMFAWSLGWLNRHGCGRILLIVIAVVMATCPLCCVHSITMWKDGPFAALLLVFSLYVLDVALGLKQRRSDLLRLVLLALLVSLLRNNGIYIVVATLMYLLVVTPDMRRRISAGLAGLVAAFLFIQGPLFALIGVEPGRFSESLGVPLQQIALISIERGLDDEDQEFIDELLPVERLEEVYRDSSVNPIKFNEAFDDSFLEANKFAFFGTWARIISKSPGVALKAWVLLTGDIWHIGKFAEIGTKDTYDFEVPVDLMGFGWDPRGLFNASQKQFPYLLSKGSMVWSWLWLGILVLALQRGHRRQLAAFLMPGVTLLATLLVAAPAGWDYRYVYYFAVCIPFMFFFVADGMRSRGRDDSA